MGYSVENKIDMVLNIDQFEEVRKRNGMSKKDVHDKLEDHGIALEYKSFLNLTKNKVTWRLVYAYTLSKIFGKEIDDLFEIVEIPIEIPEEDTNDQDALVNSEDNPNMSANSTHI